MASRILLGVSEGPLFSLASSYIKAHFESHENGKPNAFIGMGASLGLAVGYPFIGQMLAVYHWQDSFHVLGWINLLVGLPLVLAFVRMPNNTGTGTGSAAKAYLGGTSLNLLDLVKGALKTKHLGLAVLLASASLAYLFGSTNWLPAYLREARGFSIKEMGWLASLPPYATLVAVLLGGALIDRIKRHQVPLIFLGSSVGVAISVLLAISSSDRYLATIALIAGNFFWGLQGAAIPSTVVHFSRPEHTASAYGVVNGAASLVAAFMPALMGAVISSTSGSSSAGVAQGFFAGFAMLLLTQLITFGCGLRLWAKEHKSID